LANGQCESKVVTILLVTAAIEVCITSTVK